MASWGTVRLAVLERDGFRCRRCLRPAADAHHRQLKGVGGTSDGARMYGMANLVSLCRQCHDEVHANPEASYASGFLVHSGADPESIPLATGMVRVVLKMNGSTEETGNECWF